MTIVIIEDEELILNGVESIIKTHAHFPCKILKANSAKDGLMLSRKLNPNLIITDIVMPGMTGLDLVEQVRKEKLCEHFIVLSGHDNFSFAQRAIRCGVLDYILKPINKEYLLSLIDQVHKSLPQELFPDSENNLPNIPFFEQTFNTSHYPSSLEKVIAYIQQNYTKDICLQSISEHLFLHPSYVSTLINKYMGLSFSNYLDFIRITKASKLLIHRQDLSVAEISFLAGYSNERRLYHAFQKHLLMTPGDFRKQYENLS